MNKEERSTNPPEHKSKPLRLCFPGNTSHKKVDFTWSHLVSLGFACSHLVSLGCTWSHFMTPGLQGRCPSNTKLYHTSTELGCPCKLTPHTDAALPMACRSRNTQMHDTCKTKDVWRGLNIFRDPLRTMCCTSDVEGNS